MKVCYLIPALWILSCATLRHAGADNLLDIKERHKRMVFDIIPQATTKVDIYIYIYFPKYERTVHGSK